MPKNWSKPPIHPLKEWCEKEELITKIKYIHKCFYDTDKPIEELNFIYSGLCAGLKYNEIIDMWKEGLRDINAFRCLSSSMRNASVELNLLHQEILELLKPKANKFLDFISKLSMFKIKM